ncbi:unnamed protein product [Heligmosomoides polygyrus]|uniref:Stc1 domain-containing protein n=1 Tax=Heligmosomoides polygyrus TaxID=6339 RepID=A0A183GI04_HELPZ|nr:unnamed protein product [Heligmosomoides polygyrus]
MSPMLRKACPDSNGVLPMSRQEFLIQTTCQRCRAKHVRLEKTCDRRRSSGAWIQKRCHQCRERPSRFRRRVTDVAQCTFGSRTHITDVVQQASGFRRGVTVVAPGVPDSHDVFPVKVGPVMGTSEGWGSSKGKQ